MEVYLFLPQMRLTMDAIVDRAQAAEAAGFVGIAFMDHLAPPMAEDQPMHDAMVTASWVAARTSRLRVGHLVLCDSFRHPAMLAREAVTLDHASGGRFDLGLGWGSVPTEFPTFGIGSVEPKVRVGRMRETLEVLRLLWTGEAVSYDGVHHRLVDAVARPTPLGGIPITIGGAGPKTLDLVREHATWWNLPVNKLGELDALRNRVGAARVSVQHMVAFVGRDADREAVETTMRRRFGGTERMGGVVLGDAEEVATHFRRLGERGIDRVYAWFTDFAPPATLAEFAEVIAAVA